MAKIFKKNYIISPIILMVLLLAVFWFSNPGIVRANPGTVEFTSDVILDLSGLDTTTYIASGAKADNSTISGTDLNVYGIWDGIAFLLKTADHKVLQMTPSGGTADLTFSSNNVSSGYVAQWTAKSPVSVAYIVGVPKANALYQVKTDGTAISGSPFNSGASAEVSFNYTGSGDAEVFTIEEITGATVLTNSATNVQTTTATGNGDITDTGGDDVDKRGFVYDTATHENPENVAPASSGYGNYIEDSSGPYGTGAFSKTLAGLAVGTTYYMRAYAHNSVGYSYGDEVSFSTANIPCGDHTVDGYAWADNIGWVDFACTSTDDYDYGVDINSDDYVSTSSYAWSDNIGWITFDPGQAGTPPSGGYNYTANGYLAKLEISTNPPQLRGWGRALSHGGGWDGWINLHPSSGSSYGVTLDTSVSPKEFRGWAWGSDVVGWISFNCKTGGSNSSDICSSSNYNVFMKNKPPYVTNVTSSFQRCGVAPATELEKSSWQYNDTNGDVQSDYEIQVDDNSDFSSPVIDCTITTTTAPVYSGDTDTALIKVKTNPTTTCSSPTPDLQVAYNKTYYQRARIKDGTDWSDWATGSSFTTDPHAYPWVDWTYVPSRVHVNEVVTSTNNSICYDSSNNTTTCNWLWSVNGNSTPDGTWKFATTSPTSTAISKEPSFVFETSSVFGVDLKATNASDSDYHCHEIQNIYVSPHLPSWREVKP